MARCKTPGTSVSSPSNRRARRTWISLRPICSSRVRTSYAQDAPFKNVADVDAPGRKIGVGLGSVYDLYLTRTLKNAVLIRNPNGGAAGGIEPFLDQHLDAAAGVREPLDAYAKDHPDTRVMPDAFEEIQQAIGTPKGRPAGLAYLRQFVEEMKANGFVADALKRSGQTAPVAPPAN